MKKKNVLIIISIIVALVLSLSVLSGCLVGKSAYNQFKNKVESVFKLKQKQKARQFIYNNCRFLKKNLKNKNFLKQKIGKTPFVGITMSSTEDIEGVLVINVVPGSPADDAGIEAHDIITFFDGKQVSNPKELYMQVLQHEPGDSVKITLSRAGNDLEFNLTLESAAKFIKISKNLKKAGIINS
jgi:predicted metalloprotease with PDZ domain